MHRYRGSRRWIGCFCWAQASGLAGIGHPKGVIGNNFSVRRSTYHKLGTFRAIENTDPYDDLSLMNAVVESGDKVVFPADGGLTLYTKPLESIYEVARQRKRWLMGMRETGWLGKSVIGFGLTAHVSLTMWFLLSPFWALVPYLLLVLGNACVITPMLIRYRRLRLVWLLPLYPIFTTAYIVLVALMSAGRKKSTWKGRQLQPAGV